MLAAQYPFDVGCVVNPTSQIPTLGIKLSKINSLMKRKFSTMVKFYIVLVKDHFYGKPFSYLYYQKIMNYLKFNSYEDDQYHMTHKNSSNILELKDYYPSSIYATLEKS